MNLILYPFTELLSEEYFNKLIDSDSITKDWVLLSSPLPVVTILAVYILVVFKLGPSFMASRSPYELKHVIRLYNVIQVIFNVYLFSGSLKYPRSMVCIIENSCSIKTLDLNQDCRHLRKVLLYYCWLYLVLKILDLLDTVFMVLRKKDSHITFLHVYHHTIMVFSTWFSTAYTEPFQFVIPAMINEAVHVFVYTYYFLATFPRIKKQLWWKKHLTKLQLAQFVVILTYVVALYNYGCQIPQTTTYIWVFNVFMFLLLFLNFYVKAYTSKSPAGAEQSNHTKLH